jgi:taurine dioxygenase
MRSLLATESTLQIHKVKEHIAAYTHSVDLREPIDEGTRQVLYDAVVDNVALVIRDQSISPVDFERAASLFGELMEDQNRLYLAPGVPMVSTLSNRHNDSTGKSAKVGKNANWHTDHTNQKLPPKFTMLYAVEVPDLGGGTAVCNMRAAYEALPADLKQRIDGMRTANTLISSVRAKSGILTSCVSYKKPKRLRSFTHWFAHTLNAIAKLFGSTRTRLSESLVWSHKKPRTF